MVKEFEISYNNVNVEKIHKIFKKINLICTKEKTLIKRKTYKFKNDIRRR